MRSFEPPSGRSRCEHALDLHGCAPHGSRQAGQELNRAPIRPDVVIGLIPPVVTTGPPPAPRVPVSAAVPTNAARKAGQHDNIGSSCR
jgi:hypothetical protein